MSKVILNAANERPLPLWCATDQEVGELGQDGGGGWGRVQWSMPVWSEKTRWRDLPMDTGAFSTDDSGWDISDRDSLWFCGRFIQSTRFPNWRTDTCPWYKWPSGPSTAYNNNTKLKRLLMTISKISPMTLICLRLLTKKSQLISVKCHDIGKINLTHSFWGIW